MKRLAAIATIVGLGTLGALSIIVYDGLIPDRWSHVMSKVRLRDQENNPCAMKREEIHKALGYPDEPNMVKGYDLWIDKKIIRRAIDISYFRNQEKEDDSCVYFINMSAYFWFAKGTSGRITIYSDVYETRKR
ncbi:hypothetical protein [Prosthecomicrobium hirschii]|uniref:hypothetical protein n=1 Tax=Prosthecodimorpha hirschii TaxID=665126 RepID=UPI002220745A|nr:hypothetical protein [Prosthecomicrobium hirschii]MCW1843626.1 hypothetical protein [Prosthecomicrobium hirschii]